MTHERAHQNREHAERGGSGNGFTKDAGLLSTRAWPDRHFVNSLTFIQMATPPAARPTNNPTSTNTGPVCSQLSSPTPASKGTKTEAAKKSPIPAMSAPVGAGLEGRAMPELILPGVGFGQ